MSRKRVELRDMAAWKRQSATDEFLGNVVNSRDKRIPSDLPATNLFIPKSPSQQKRSSSSNAELSKNAWERQQGRPSTADNSVIMSPQMAKDSNSTPLLPVFASPFAAPDDKTLDAMSKDDMQLTYTQARLKASGQWTKEGNTNAVSRTFPLRSDPRALVGLEGNQDEDEKDDRHVERMRTNQMTGDQKAADVIQSAGRKAEFIKMQREIVEEKLSRLRKTPGYQDSEPVEKPLPDLKAALNALVGVSSELDDSLARLIAEEDKAAPQRKKSLSFHPNQDEDGSESALAVHTTGPLERPGERLKSKVMFRESLKKKNMEFANLAIAGMSFSALHGYRSHAGSPLGNNKSSRLRWNKMDQVRASVKSNSGAVSSTLGLKSSDAAPLRNFGESLKAMVSSLMGAPSSPLAIETPGGGRQGSLKRLMSSVSTVMRLKSMRTVSRSMSTVLIPDATLLPDTETEEALEAALEHLRDIEGEGDDDTQPLTYSHLYKPTSKSAKSSFVPSGPNTEEWPADASLAWPCRGLGLKKMPLLQETLLANRSLTGLRLPGNNLTNECVALLLSYLSHPDAPAIHQMDLSMNSSLTWMCAYPLSAALGGSNTPQPHGASKPDPSPTRASFAWEPSSLEKAATPTVKAEASNPLMGPDHVINTLGLSRLLLEGVKLQDKGAMILAQAMSKNKTLKELSLARCSITDAGGAAVFQALAESPLVSLDISWNQLGIESAKAFLHCLGINGSLTKCNLSHNGFSDLDASVILKGLMNHGTWKDVDLSYNNIGSGSALVISELTDLLGQKAADLMAKGSYALEWDLDNTPPGKFDVHASKAGPNRHALLGAQLTKGPLLLDISGNPLGATGLKQLLHSLDWMSMVLENAAVDQAEKAGMLASYDWHEHITSSLAWPIQVIIASCNIDINDSNASALLDVSMDPHSPNPFIKSLFALREAPDLSSKDKGKDSKGGNKGKGTDAKKGAEIASKAKLVVIKETSQQLDLTSPAGDYRLNAAHPASWIAIKHLLALNEQVADAASQGLLKDVQFSIKEVVINGKPSKMEKLSSLTYEELPQGYIEFTVVCPSVLNASDQAPISDQVVEWLADSLADRSSSELWKLSVVKAATNSFYFSYEQTLALSEIFDSDMQTNERLKSGELFYAKCVQPIEYWLEVMPLQPPRQITLMVESLADLAAFDKNNPTGRYLLNLSRQLDRIIARRLQDAASLEGSHRLSPFFFNWRNATLNGSPLSRDGLKNLRSYTIPDTGSLRFDYVSYRVPEKDAEVCDEEDVDQLVRDLRSILIAFDLGRLRVRSEYLPFQQRASLIREAKQREAMMKSIRVPHRGSLAQSDASNQSSNQVKQVSETDADVALPPQRSRMLLSHIAKELKAERARAKAGKVDPTDTSSLSWWQQAGFNAGSSLLKQHNELVKAREEKMEAIRRRLVSSTPLPTAATPVEVKVDASKAGKDKGDKKAVKEDKKKGGKEDKGDKKAVKEDKGEKKKDKEALPPPHLRTQSDFADPWAESQAKELAMILLLANDIKDVQLLLSKFSAKHIARVCRFLVQVDPKTGVNICRAMLEALPPVAAARLLYSNYDQGATQLLPTNIRLAILAACPPEMIKHLTAVNAELETLAVTRARSIRVTLQCFAAYKAVSCNGLSRVLSMLRNEQDRCSAFVCFWSRIADRQNIPAVYQLLKPDEQRQVMNRLGHWHVWSTLQNPENLHFFLELTDPEQKEIAKLVIKQGIKLSVQAKAAAKAAGLISSPAHLLRLFGNGFPLVASEEDSLWRMIENSYTTVEFDFRPTNEQLESAREHSALTIQRQWRQIRAAREMKRVEACATSVDPVIQMEQVVVPFEGEMTEDGDEDDTS